MEISFLDNDSGTLGTALDEAADGADEARATVAFAKQSGVEAAAGLCQLVDRGVPVRLLAGIDFQLTDMNAVESFDRAPSEARIYFRPPGEERRAFHPKVYTFRRGNAVTAFVGSSNLTAGGVGHNVEANLVIRGSDSEPVIRSITDFHDRLWNSALAVQVTGEFRERYRRLQDRRRAAELALRSDADYAMAQSTLRAAVAEAMTGYPRGNGTHSWMLITSPDNYLRCIGGRVWGDEDMGRIGQVRTGDIVFFYVKGAKYVAAMCVVTRPPYEDRTVIWHDDDRLYPFRFNFDVLIQPPHPVRLRPLVPQLDLFGRQEARSWGTRLQAAMKELTPHDVTILRAALATAAGLELAS